MRLIMTVSFCFLCISCSLKQIQKNEQLAVIATVYERIPKTLPPPPIIGNENEVEHQNNIGNIVLKHLNFNYGINENFVYYDFDYINGISDVFYIYKSKELFAEDTIDSSYMTLVAELSKLKEPDKIDKAQFAKLSYSDLAFWDRPTITNEEKKENNLSGIISFSRVSFNKDFSKAAVVVGDYFERIGSGASLYILVKTDDKWVIKYEKTLEKS